MALPDLHSPEFDLTTEAGRDAYADWMDERDRQMFPDEVDPPETTVNDVSPEDTDRAFDPDQEPVSRFPGSVDYPFQPGA